MPHKVDHILVPVDFSENSELAMKTALDYFGDKVGKITILTVYEGSQKGNYGEESEIDEMMSKSATIEMTRFTRLFENEHANIETIISKGNPANEIISTAKNIKADLIIMGSQGRNSLASVFFGGTTYQVARKAHCSVYVIRK